MKLFSFNRAVGLGLSLIFLAVLQGCEPKPEKVEFIILQLNDVYEIAEMIIKVKEPIEPEYKLCKKDQLIFTYFHFASHEPLTKAMIDSGAVCLAYETVEKPDRSLPLLVPMSEVA